MNKEIDKDLILFAAEALRKLQDEDGHIAAGKNGPYFDSETPVRNTAHAVILFDKASVLVDEGYKERAAACIDWLLRTDFYVKEAANYIQRTNANKDQWNGVIGAAWVLETLSYWQQRYPSTEVEQRIRDLLRGLVGRHLFWRFSYKERSIVDRTFNHQLWLLYSVVWAKKVIGEPLSASEMESLSKELRKTLIQRQDGLVRHPLNVSRNRLIGVLIRIYYGSRQKGLTQKEMGYHSFNVYALSRLEDLGFGYCKAIAGAVALARKYASGAEYRSSVVLSKYSIGYNNPHLELYSIENESENADWITEGKKSLLAELKSNCSEATPQAGNVDWVIRIARVYELALVSGI